MSHSVFRSEVYKRITYTIQYDEREGYKTTVYLTPRDTTEDSFTSLANATNWAKDVINKKLEIR